MSRVSVTRLQRRRELRALEHRPFGIELGGELRTADQVRLLAARFEPGGERAVRFLPGADDDGIGFDDACGALREALSACGSPSDAGAYAYTSTKVLGEWLRVSFALSTDDYITPTVKVTLKNN